MCGAVLSEGIDPGAVGAVFGDEVEAVHAAWLGWRVFV